MKYPWSLAETIFTAVTKYHEISAVEVYDQRMRTVRNVASENNRLLDLLRQNGALHRQARLLEIGTGTGAFARSAPPFCQEVLAVDVSKVMLEYAKKKSAEFKITNIRYENAGFLSFDNSEPFDAVVSSLALHHINDVWKAEAVKRIYNSLRPNGIFLLVDVLFDCEGGELDHYLQNNIPADMNEVMKKDLYEHVATESSTLRWIMDGIIEHAGFKILQFEKFDVMPHLYLCQKIV